MVNARRDVILQQQISEAGRVITTLDVAIPAQLTLALVPDLVLIGGAMILLVSRHGRPTAIEHQRMSASPASFSLESRFCCA